MASVIPDYTFCSIRYTFALKPSRAASLLICCLAAACARKPEWYGMPPQRAALASFEPQPFGAFVAMNDPNAEAYIVGDIAKSVEAGTWRWAFAKPELRYWLDSAGGVSFSADFTIAGVTFEKTGPVTVRIFIDGKLLDSVECRAPGERHFEKLVPSGWLTPRREVRVVLQPDRTWRASYDGKELGLILLRAGFVP